MKKNLNNSDLRAVYESEVATPENMRRVKSHIHAMMRDRSYWVDERDLVSETFARAWRGLPKFRGQSCYYTWLYRITRNTVLDRLRQIKHNRETVSLETGDNRIERNLEFRIEDHSQWSNPQECLERQQRNRIIEAAIARLPDNCGKVVQLKLSGLSHKQIARILNTTEEGSRNYYFRAIRKLQEIVPRIVG